MSIILKKFPVKKSIAQFQVLLSEMIRLTHNRFRSDSKELKTIIKYESSWHVIKATMHYDRNKEGMH